MAGQNMGGIPDQYTVTEIVDENGRVVHEFVLRKQFTVDPQGKPCIRTESQNLTLADGSVYSPAMQKNGVTLALCEICRDPPGNERLSHGLVMEHNCTRCANAHCHIICCAHHSILCSDDYHRCPRCARWFEFRAFFRKLFFRQEG